MNFVKSNIYLLLLVSLFACAFARPASHNKEFKKFARQLTLYGRSASPEADITVTEYKYEDVTSSGPEMTVTVTLLDEESTTTSSSVAKDTTTSISTSTSTSISTSTSTPTSTSTSISTSTSTSISASTSTSATTKIQVESSSTETVASEITSFSSKVASSSIPDASAHITDLQVPTPLGKANPNTGIASKESENSATSLSQSMLACTSFLSIILASYVFNELLGF